MNVNPSYQPSELRYALNKVGIRALIAAESFKDRDYYTILNEAVPELCQSSAGSNVESSQVPNLKNVIMISNIETKCVHLF